MRSRSSSSVVAGRFFLIAVLVVAATILIVFRSIEQTGDSLEYAGSIRSGELLFHPHHLLFNPIVRVLWKGIAVIFPTVSPIEAAQVHNIFWALVVLAAVFSIVRRMTGSPAAAALGALALFASLGFWQFATFVEVYLPAMGCLAVILAVLHVPRVKPLSLWEEGGIVLLFVLSVLYDQMAVLFTLPLVVLLVQHLRGRKIVRAGGLIIAAGGIVIAVYVAAFLTVSGPKTLSGFIHWCLSYAFHPDPSWGSWSNVSVLGIGKLFLSFARIVLNVPRSLWVGAAIVAAILSGALAFLTARAIARRKPEANFRIALSLWVICTALFMWWFAPLGYELAILLLLAFLCLIVRSLADAWESASRSGTVRGLIRGLSGAIVAGLLVFNFITAVQPAHAGRGDDYARAVLLQRLAPERAIIVTDYFLMENLHYYYKRDAVLEETGVLFPFYRHLEIPADITFSSGRPVIVRVSFLVPGTKYSRPFNGDNHPAEWRSLIEALFDCEIRNGRVVSARNPSAIAELPGYLLLSGEKRPVAGFAELFRRLDEAAAVAEPPSSGAFSAWLSRHPDGER